MNIYLLDIYKDNFKIKVLLLIGICFGQCQCGMLKEYRIFAKSVQTQKWTPKEFQVGKFLPKIVQSFYRLS